MKCVFVYAAALLAVSCDRDVPIPAAESIQVMAALPPFDLVERDGEPFGSADLQGRVWIANFIFTRCAGPCPALTSQMYLLQKDLKSHAKWDDIRLVSFTVDPEHDQPAVLAERARLSLADPDHWLWLTGTRAQIWQLVEKGFLLPVGENANDPTSPILHSQKFVLVDPAGMIRGYYDGLDEAERDRLKRDLDVLLR